VSALPGLRTRAQTLLDTDSKRRAYAAMDGLTKVRTIEANTGANHNDIAQWLKVWMPEGLVDPDSSPPKAACTLTELGIDAPAGKGERGRKANGGGTA
jgi:hypothetical protein